MIFCKYSFSFILILAALIGGQVYGENLDDIFAAADDSRTSNIRKFAELLNVLGNRKNEFSDYQIDYFTYLDIYKDSLSGEYIESIERHKELVNQSEFTDIKYRSTYSIISMYGVMRKFYEGAQLLNRLDALSRKIDDPKILNGGEITKAIFYQEANQYQLAFSIAMQLTQKSLLPRSKCIVSAVLVESAYYIEAEPIGMGFVNESELYCNSIGEAFLGSFISITKAKMHVDAKQNIEARQTLEKIEKVVTETNYPRLSAMYYATKAEVLYSLGNFEAAISSAQLALGQSAQAKFNKPLVSSYLTLSNIEHARGNYKTALDYHKSYVAADKAYDSELQSNQLAFQRAQFESELNARNLELAYAENELLSAEAITAKQEAKNSLLAAALAISALAIVFVSFYRTHINKKKFKQLAETDGLTKLKNRREFCKRSQEAIDFCHAGKHAISMIILDLDHFKQINDTHGHAAGDAVLKSVSALLKQECRQNDIVGRLGGEEFGITLPSCDGDKARFIAESLRQKIEALPISHNEKVLSATASFGIVEGKDKLLSYDALFNEADAALYQAKHAGRNRVQLIEISL